MSQRIHGWNGLILATVTAVQAAGLAAPLAASEPPGVVIDFSPPASRQYIGSPSLAKLPDGTLVASHDFFGPGSTRDTTVVFQSADGGATWSQVAKIQGQWWSSLWAYRDALYLIGTSKEYGHTVIRRSTDGGKSWTEPTDERSGLLLADGRYHTAPVPVLVHQGRVWRTMEDAMGPGGWGSHFRAFVLSAPEDADLLDASQWTASERLGRNPDWLDGTFGGWLEGNIVANRNGNLLNILRVHQPSPMELAAVVRVTADGKGLAFNPENDFVPFPGGSKKFQIRYDAATDKYWALANWVRPADADDRPDRVRNTLGVLVSDDLRSWNPHRILLHHTDPKHHGFQYVDWMFDGEDLLVVSRTAFGEGDKQARNQHDANYMTFHRFPSGRQSQPIQEELVPVRVEAKPAKPDAG